MLFDISIDLDSFVSDDPLVETVAFSVNAKHFLESFISLSADDSVHLIVTDDRLNIEIHTDECIEYSSLWISPTQTLSNSGRPEYPDVIRVKNLNLQKRCKALQKASSEIIVRGNPRRITMSSNLAQLLDRGVKFGDEKATVDEFKDVYCAELLSNISKISTLSDELCFYAQAGEPLCIGARFGVKGKFEVVIKSIALREEEEK
jgi:hypothetical protein